SSWGPCGSARSSTSTTSKRSGEAMGESGLITWAVFLGASSLVLLVFMLLGGGKSRLDARLQDLSSKGSPHSEPDALAGLARTAPARMGAALLPSDEEERTRLQTRLIHAGFYSRQAMVFFLGVKMLLMVGPAVLGLFLGLLGLVSVQQGLIFGAVLGVLGMIGPSFWLDKRKAARQGAFRRALPDALDVIVICLEGGLSLPGTIRRLA